MIRLRNVKLADDAATDLSNWQEFVNGKDDYEAQVAAAKSEFSRQNTKQNKTFQLVKKSLKKMCSGARRCVYCEDSCADEVEHIKPKDLYPEEVFVWGNYVYACGPCNGPKNNRYAVFSSATKQMVEVTRKRKSPVTPPEDGKSVLINPRWEDPLKFMELEIIDTFTFWPTKPKGTRDYERADYTIRLLRLNERDELLAARKEAYESYVARLEQYIKWQDEGKPPKRLRTLESALKKMHHPTVWKEIKRQQHLVPTLKVLFDRVPEALKW